MRKFLTALGVAALLSVSAWGTAFAAVVTSTVAGGLDAAGEVSATLTVPAGTTVTVFSSGTYSAANRFELQEEVGSPGSGVFRKVLRLDTGTANEQAENSFTAGPNRSAFRVLMTVAGTGDVMVQMTDRAQAAAAFTPDSRSVLHFFDDFAETQTTAVNASLYLTIDNDSSGTIAVIDPAVQEGAMTLASGTVGDRADEAALGPIDVSDWAGLVSDGPILFEVSMQADVLAGIWGIALTTIDIPSATNASSPFDVDSGVVTEENSHVDAVAILMQSEATDVDGWQAASSLGSAEGNDGGAIGTGLEFVLGTAVAATYTTLRVETDATGDCYFYIDGNLQYAEDLCVATTARLGWFVWANTDTTAAAVTLIIDYVVFQTTKPAS